jgi:hypothetical protein
MSWEEFATFTVCFTLDLIEVLAPIFLTPLLGDIIDFFGFLFSVIYFNYLGALTLLELIPGLDVMPFFTITWLVWYFQRRRRLRRKMDQELQQWL